MMSNVNTWWVTKKLNKEYLTPEEMTKRISEQDKLREEIIELQRKDCVNRLKPLTKTHI